MMIWERPTISTGNLQSVAATSLVQQVVAALGVRALVSSVAATSLIEQVVAAQGVRALV